MTQVSNTFHNLVEIKDIIRYNLIRYKILSSWILPRISIYHSWMNPAHYYHVGPNREKYKYKRPKKTRKDSSNSALSSSMILTNLERKLLKTSITLATVTLIPVNSIHIQLEQISLCNRIQIYFPRLQTEISFSRALVREKIWLLLNSLTLLVVLDWLNWRRSMRTLCQLSL